MDPVEMLAERRIREAMDRGELDDLPGAGRPLMLDDDSHVPPSLRAAYRVLKNAGFLPPELQWRREVEAAEALLAAALTPADRKQAWRRVEWLRLRLDAQGRRDLRLDAAYYQAVCERLDKHTGS